jgi:hypothetical protein
MEWMLAGLVLEWVQRLGLERERGWEQVLGIEEEKWDPI